VHSRQSNVDWSCPHDEPAADNDEEDALDDDDDDDDDSVAVVEAITTVLSSNFYTPRTSLSLENRRGSGAASTTFDGSFAMVNAPKPETGVALKGNAALASTIKSHCVTSWSSTASSSTITALAACGTSSISSAASAGVAAAAAGADGAAGVAGSPCSLAASKELCTGTGHLEGVESIGTAACPAIPADGDAADARQRRAVGQLPSNSSSSSLKTACSTVTDAEVSGCDRDGKRAAEADVSGHDGDAYFRPTAAELSSTWIGPAAQTLAPSHSKHAEASSVGDTAVAQVLPAGTALESLTVGQLLQLLMAAVTLGEQASVTDD
jgi:hypothetical protein